MATDRFLLRSTRGVVQEVEFQVTPHGSGYCVKGIHRIEGCLPRNGPNMLTPIPYEHALTWMQSRSDKLSRSAAKFKPARFLEDVIKEMFFG